MIFNVVTGHYEQSDNGVPVLGTFTSDQPAIYVRIPALTNAL
jgi:hypothetical protein